MSQCNKCGSQTTRTRLCRQCSLDERHGQALIEAAEQEREQAEETMNVECGDCGLVYEVGMTSRKTCPDCGHEGYRPLEALQ